MQITLSSPTHLKITWPIYDPAIDQEIRRRLATVPGIEAGRDRVAWAPIIQLARLVDLFPKASLEYEAIRAADNAARMFYWLLWHNGARFSVDLFGVVQVTGEHVSPLLEQLVADRSHAIKRFVAEPVPMPVEQSAKSADDMSRHNGVPGWRPGEEYGEPVTDAQYPKRRRRYKKRKVKA